MKLMPKKYDFPEGHMGTESKPLAFYDNFYSLNFQEDYPLYPYGIELATREHASWYHEVYSRHYTIVMLTEGRMVYDIDDQRFVVKKGNILIIPIGAEYRYETTQKPFYKKVSLFILGVNVSSIMEMYDLHYAQMLRSDHVDMLCQIIHRIDDCMKLRDECDLPRMCALTFEFLISLSQIKAPEHSRLMAIRTACSRLNSNFTSKINLTHLAHELNMNERSFQRLFKKALGVSARSFRRQCKIKEACCLLTNTSLSIKQISNRLGYCNQFYFSTEFSKITGVPPKEYRKSPFNPKE
jgi:AraC-like DNA-binding protein